MIALIFAVALLQGLPAQPQPQMKTQMLAAKTAVAQQTFTGVISDGQCAAKGSHNEVMKKASVNSPANCVKGCARKHGFVLYDAATKKIYKLSDQERPAGFADKRVRVKGSLDAATGTILVTSIEPAK